MKSWSCQKYSGDYSGIENVGTKKIVTLVSCRTTHNDEENPYSYCNGVQSDFGKFAVSVKNAEYVYPRSTQKVLDDLSMTVQQGSIYGLTGSSGCGKTTLISCILGTRTLNAGHILLYGYRSTHSNIKKFVEIPGKDVGYMPQEISLYSKFTIHEILMYFGRLYGMPTYDIIYSIHDILKLLNLSRKTTQIGLLSGGEQRRVSFAVPLIHSPKLLVLDEPTVGVDPLLRIRIWDHLRKLVTDQQVTVIITSHYLDEMRKADMIGVMRDGRIIAEDSPNNLLSTCNASSLDDAVLKLCKNSGLLLPKKYHKDMGNKNGNSFVNCDYKGHYIQFPQFGQSRNRIKALIGKNVLILLRNIPLFLFVMCIPAFQLLIVLLIGYEPYELHFGVVNEELTSHALSSNESLSSLSACPNFTNDSLLSCDLHLLSCRYLSHISTNKMSLENFNSEDDATKAVNSGDIYGYLKFSDTFSTSLVDRALTHDDENDTVATQAFVQSRIQVRLDQSNTIIYQLLLFELYNAQEAFLTSLLSSCGANRQKVEYSLQYGTPVFGRADEFNFSEYVAPGASIPFMFFFSIISGGLRFVEDRNSGTLERMLISGVTLSEIMAAFLVSELLVITIQSSLIFALISWWLPIYGYDYVAAACAFFLMMLAGYTGVSMGFLIGSWCTEQIQVAVIAITFILPNIILSGIIWPVEGMSHIMRIIVKLLPCNLSSQAVSNIWTRGMDISHSNVWPGIVVLCAYIIILNLLTTVYHKCIKK